MAREKRPTWLVVSNLVVSRWSIRHFMLHFYWL